MGRQSGRGLRVLPVLLVPLFLLFFGGDAGAALQSRINAVTFKPAVDGGEYFSVYSSQNLKSWQGNLGFYFDYANRPVQFVGTGAAVGRQSVIDHFIIADLYGSIGFTDWYEVGITVPVVLYNWFFTDDAAAVSDHGAGMGDVMLTQKFRIINTENSRVGFSVAPFVTLPTGDFVRYMGDGSVTGGLNLITDFIFHERFNLAVNLGATFRDDVTLHGVRFDDRFNGGVAANIKFTRFWNGIIEAFSSTTLRNFYKNSGESPFEVGGGSRFIIGDSGFSVDVGATAGVINGVGAPRVRGFVGMNWTSPIAEECPECPPPAPPPDPRIRGDKIVIWGKIFFDTDKTTIKPISFPVLDDVVDVMQKNPQLKLVEVQGHCDIRGGDAYNMKLSQGRANSVVEYLVSKGVDQARLVGKGYGFHNPIADNTSKEGMSQNRRVEFVIQQREF